MKDDIPNITFEEAEVLWRETEHVRWVVDADLLGSIDAVDAAAFFIEGYQYARKLQRRLRGAKCKL